MQRFATDRLAQLTDIGLHGYIVKKDSPNGQNIEMLLFPGGYNRISGLTLPGQR